MTTKSRSDERQRSFPIAIQRVGGSVGDERQIDIGDNSDDEDCNALQDQIKSMSLGYVGSVPTRQPGIRRKNVQTTLPSSLPPSAPLLVSKGSNINESHEPPPMTLPENMESYTALTYGSLRESHMEGKFLDGPSSYRDRSGQIHELRHNQRVNFDASATSYNLATLLPPQNTMSLHPNAPMEKFSLGDRILAGTSAAKKSPTTSTLANMMKDAPAATTFQSSVASFPAQPGVNDRYDPNDESSGALSTSLTALEILQGVKHYPDLLRDFNKPCSAPVNLMPSDLHHLPAPPPVLPPYVIHDGDDEDHHQDMFELDFE